MQDELISVIVPVYNVEGCIDRCLKSILNQKYEHYEVLLIDDGSTDASGEMCDEYEQKYASVKAFHKVNGGLGSARNYGIENASGEYVCFVDSDDEIEADYLNLLYEAITSSNADVSIAGYFYVNGGKQIAYTNQSGDVLAENVLDEYGKGNSLYYFATNKLYRKRIFAKMPILFENRHCAEDMYFNCIYFRYIAKATMVKAPLYKYYVNLESLSNGRRPLFWEDMLKVYAAFETTCATIGAENGKRATLLAVLLRNSISNFFNQKTSVAECKEYIEACVRIKDISEIEGVLDHLGRVDRLMMQAVIKKKYRRVWLYTKTIKRLKRKHFGTFCKIRKAIRKG